MNKTRATQISNATVIGHGTTGDLHLALALAATGTDVHYITENPQTEENTISLARHQKIDTTNIHFSTTDIDNTTTLATQIKETDVIFNFAYPFSWSAKDQDNETLRHGIDTVRSVISAAKQKGASRIVQCSSHLCLGHAPGGGTVDATSPYQTDDRRTHFERCLYRAEMEAWQGAEDGLKVTTVCVGWILGPGGGNSLADKIMSDAQMASLTASTKKSGFVDARDAADAFILATKDEYIGKRIVCTGNNISMADVVDAFLKTKELNKPTKSLIYKIRHALNLLTPDPTSPYVREEKNYAPNAALTFRPIEETATYCWQAHNRTTARH